jgi:hypothetical protein
MVLVGDRDDGEEVLCCHFLCRNWGERGVMNFYLFLIKHLI